VCDVERNLGAVEARFAEMLWEREPLTSAQAVQWGEEVLQWKKSTTFTVLRRLCDKGLFQNNRGVITSQISRQDFYAQQSERFVEETFEGSLPAFLAAFTSRKMLSPQDVEELRRMVAMYEEDC